MGLLDGFSDFAKTPEGQGLLAATFGGLAGARSGAPINSLGRAGLAGLSGYGNAQDRETQLAQIAQQKKMQDMQMAQNQMQLDAITRQKADEQEMRDLAKSATITPEQARARSMGPTLDGGPVPELKPGFNNEQYIQSLFAAGKPMQAIQFQQSTKPKEPEAFTLGEGQVRYLGDKVVATGPEKQAPMPSAVQEYNFAKGQGYPGTFEQWSTSQKKAGATNVSTKVETKMGESLASQVGPMVKDTYTAAQGAVQQVDAAKRIVDAVDSGKIIAGPLAGGRLKVAQIGQLLGATGKDDAETIARSRDVIRGLSEMTLQGRKQMTGQGAITESEGKLAEKANSGDIADLTPAEIKQLAKASARAAKFIYQQHDDNLKNLSGDPATAGLGRFYKVRPLPAFPYEDPQQPASSGVADLVNKYRSR